MTAGLLPLPRRPAPAGRWRVDQIRTSGVESVTARYRTPRQDREGDRHGDEPAFGVGWLTVSGRPGMVALAVRQPLGAGYEGR